MESSIEFQAAIKLFFPDDERVISIESLDNPKLISVLRVNRLPIATLPKNNFLLQLKQNKDFTSYLLEENKCLADVIHPYTEIATAWADAGIESLLIKSPGYFPYVSDNLDILVRDCSKDHAAQILRNLGYIELPRIREPYKDLYRKINGKFIYFPVHLHTQVAWINSFISDSEMFSNVQQTNGKVAFKYPSAEYGILTTMAHCFYEDKSICLRDLYNISIQLNQGINWDVVWKQSSDEGWIDGLRFCITAVKHLSDQLNIYNISQRLPEINHEDFPLYLAKPISKFKNQESINLPSKLSKLFCKAMQFKKSIYSKNLSFTNKIRDVCLITWYMIIVKFVWIRRTPSYIISISGLDGSGKTTLAKNLVNDLQSTFSIHSDYHWGRVGISRILSAIKSPIAKILSRNITDENNAKDEFNKSNPSEFKIFLSRHQYLRQLWVLILASEYISRQWVLIVWARLVGGIHVFDRYIVDAIIELETVYRFQYVRHIYKLVPKPDVSLLIEIDRDTAVNRSLTPAEEIYSGEQLELLNSYKENFSLTLSAYESPESISHQALGLILLSYFKR